MSLKAKELAPFTPSMDYNVGRVLYYARRFDEAEKYLTGAINENPNNNSARSILGFVYLQQPSAEKHAAALRIFEELYASDKKAFAAALGYADGVVGKKAEALAKLDELEKLEGVDDYVPTHEKALIYIGWRDREKSVLSLEKAFQEKFIGFSALNVDPLYDDLRSDSRIKNLLRQMNFND